MKQLAKEQDSPLTLKQLREMNGQPGYWAEEERWGIICVDSAGRWAGVPFFKFRGDGVNFEYNIKSRRMKIYRYPSPTKLVRAAWEPCEECKEISYWDEKCDNCRYDDLFANQEPCASCESKSKWEPCYSFCPRCGRPLTDAAWEMLEKRLEKGTDNEKY